MGILNVKNQDLNCQARLKFQARLIRQEKAHELLTHTLFETAVDPGTTNQLTRRECLCSWFRRRTHKLFCLVNRPVIQGSTGPSPEQKVYVYVPFSLPNLLFSCNLNWWAQKRQKSKRIPKFVAKNGQQKPLHNRGGICCIFGFSFSIALSFSPFFSLFSAVSCRLGTPMRLQAFFPRFVLLGAGKGAGRNGGAGRGVGKGAVPPFAWQHLCQHSCQHPVYWQ